MDEDGRMEDPPAAGWISDFAPERPDLVPTGRNPYFILELNHPLVLEGGRTKLTITVKEETRKVDGIECKVVEVSKNYFAISEWGSSGLALPGPYLGSSGLLRNGSTNPRPLLIT